MGKRNLSEEDIKARYIKPAITEAGGILKSRLDLNTLLLQVGLFFEGI